MNRWCADFRSCVHSIYLLSGPGGVYVGNSTQPEKRWKRHVSCTIGKVAYRQRVHRVIRRCGGIKRYRMDVVLSVRGCFAASDEEIEMILELRRQGLAVLNVYPHPWSPSEFNHTTAPANARHGG